MWNLLAATLEAAGKCMAALVPLLQTALWVGLIIWLIHRYNKQVSGVLTAIQKGIAEGRPVKAGSFFELGQLIRPQGVEEQSKRIDEEVQQLQATGPQALTPPSPEASRRSDVSLKKKYLLAEDLVMRELQSEFGAVINRSVRFGGVELDGIFVKEGNGYGVEVKFFRNRNSADRILLSLSRIEEALRRLGLRNFTIILALVCLNDAAVSPAVIEGIRARASQLGTLGTAIMIRVFPLQELADKFGIELDNADNA